MTRARRWQFVNVNENSLLNVTRIEGQHTLVDVFLHAFATVTRSQCAASGSGEQTTFDALSLRVSRPGDVLNDGPPFTVNIQSAQRTAVVDIAGADVSFLANPVAFIKCLALVCGIVKVFLR